MKIDLAKINFGSTNEGGGGDANLTTLAVTPSTEAQVITPSAPVDGYDRVEVGAVTAAIDANIETGNIKKDVQILGVTGSYEAGKHTGHVDTTGLQALGWDAEDIAWLQAHVWWDAEDDAEWAVTEANKAFGPAGATPLTWSNYTAQKYNPDLRYFPKLTTPSGTSMASKFSGYVNIVAIPTHGWDMSAITSYSTTFASCYSLRSVGDVSYWVTSSVTAINAVFYFCASLEEIDVSHWNTSNCTSLYQAFCCCYKLKELDISNWSFAKITSMNNMMPECRALQSLKFPSTTNAPLLTDTSNAIMNCTTLKEITINLSAASLSNARLMMQNCYGLKKVKLTISSTSLSDIGYIVGGDLTLEELDLTGIDTTSCAQAGVGTSVSAGIAGNCQCLATLKLGANFFKGSFTTLYLQNCHSWTRDSIYESLYTNQTGRDSNSAAVTVKLSTSAYDRLSAQDISDIATKNITLTRG